MTTEFNAEEYRHVKRADLIGMVRTGELDYDRLCAIADLTPDGTDDPGFYHRRVSRTIRYWLTARANEVSGGTPLPQEADGVLDYYQQRNWFQAIGGWLMYGVNWDIQKRPPFAIFPLERSLADQWHDIVKEQAVPIENVIGVTPSDGAQKLIRIADGKVVRQRKPKAESNED